MTRLQLASQMMLMAAVEFDRLQLSDIVEMFPDYNEETWTDAYTISRIALKYADALIKAEGESK